MVKIKFHVKGVTQAMIMGVCKHHYETFYYKIAIFLE